MQCFCQGQSKGKINITFGDGSQETFTSNNPPVCIDTKPLQTTITYSFNWQHAVNHPDQFDTVDGIVTWDGNCTNIGGGSCYAVLSNGFTPYFTGNNSCGITIIHTQPKAILSDASGQSLTITGTNPITFTGLCGSECPPGFCKCHSDSYPGYCCIPCDGIQNRIDSLTTIVKSLK